jgi:hypothetical protein
MAPPSERNPAEDGTDRTSSQKRLEYAEQAYAMAPEPSQTSQPKYPQMPVADMGDAGLGGIQVTPPREATEASHPGHPSRPPSSAIEGTISSRQATEQPDKRQSTKVSSPPFGYCILTRTSASGYNWWCPFGEFQDMSLQQLMGELGPDTQEVVIRIKRTV